MEQEELVEGLKAQSETAWRLYVERHGKLIRAVALRLGLDSAEADDHFQAVCLSVLHSVDGLRDSRTLVSWTYRIAYRAALDARRRRRPSVSVDSFSEAESEALQVEPTIIEEMQRLESASHLLDSLAELNSRCRRLLERLFLEEPRPSYTEISASENIPLGSIGPNRARCLEKLEKSFRKLSKPTGPASALVNPGKRGDEPHPSQEEREKP